MDQELVKLAHAAIQQLQNEKLELEQTLNKTNEAIKVAFDMFYNGQIVVEQLESKIKEFSNKDARDLDVIKKASELTKVASTMSSFKLSASARNEGMSPEDRFISSLLEDI